MGQKGRRGQRCAASVPGRRRRPLAPATAFRGGKLSVNINQAQANASGGERTTKAGERVSQPTGQDGRINCAGFSWILERSQLMRPRLQPFGFLLVFFVVAFPFFSVFGARQPRRAGAAATSSHLRILASSELWSPCVPPVLHSLPASRRCPSTPPP